MGKSNQEIEKYTIILVVENLLNLRKNLRKGIGDCKKKKKISESKTTTLAYFYNLKKKQQDQNSKNRCYTESFVTDYLKP